MSHTDPAPPPSATEAQAERSDSGKPVTATTTSTATSAAPPSTGELDFVLRPGGGPTRVRYVHAAAPRTPHAHAAQPSSYLSYTSRPAAEATRRTYSRAFLLRYQPHCTHDLPGLARWREIIEGDVDKVDKEPPPAKKDEKPLIAALPPRPKATDEASKEKDATWREDAAKRGASQPSAKRKERPKLPIRMVNDPALIPVIAMLNKITEETFGSLSSQILFFIEGCSPSIFKAVIKLIYDKAASEPKFSRMYAQLCCMISEKCPEKTEATGEVLKFRPILLSFCQEHFEKKVSPEEVVRAQRPTVDPAELEVLVKLRLLGNISFIAALYKARFLPEKVIHQYIIQPLLKEILKSLIEEDIEALTRLLSLVGGELDHPKAKNYIDAYFAKLQELSRDARLPPRCRFMLMNVLDLRRHGWRTKTEAKSASILARHGSSISLTDLDSDDGPSLLAAPAAAAVSFSSASAFSPSLSSPSPDLRRTSDGTTPRSVKFAELPSRTTSSESIPFVRSPVSIKKPPSAAPAPVAPTSPLAPSAAPQTPPPSLPPLPSYSPATSPASAAPSASAADPTIERFDAQLRLVLDEYLCSFDGDEAVLSISELQRPDLLDRVVSRAVLLCMDRKDKYRDEMQRLLTRLRTEDALPAAAFQKGLGSIMRTLHEIELDVPFAAQFVASFLGAAYRDRWLSEEEIRALVASVPQEKAAVLLSHVSPPA